MAVPKQKPSKARSRRRRAANMRLEAPSLSACGTCGNLKVSHQVCASCGYYNGVQVIALS